jgi:hypothetical protein
MHVNEFKWFICILFSNARYMPPKKPKVYREPAAVVNVCSFSLPQSLLECQQALGKLSLEVPLYTMMLRAFRLSI